MGSPLRAFCRLAAYLSLTFALIPVQAVFLALNSRRAKTLPTAFHRLCCRILGLKLEIRGQRVAHGLQPPGRLRLKPGKLGELGVRPPPAQRHDQRHRERRRAAGHGDQRLDFVHARL